jgi:hypothetical protein
MAVKRASVSSGSSVATPKASSSFVWTPELESALFSLLLQFKPAGLAAHAHIHVAVVHRHMQKLAPEISPEDIWDRVHELFDVEAANEIEIGPLNQQRRKKPQGDASDSGEDEDDEELDDDDDAQESEQDWNKKLFKFVEFSLPKKEFSSVISELRKIGKRKLLSLRQLSDLLVYVTPKSAIDNNLCYICLRFHRRRFTTLLFANLVSVGQISSASEAAASKEPKKTSSGSTASSKETETPKSAGSKKRPTRSTPSSSSSSASKKKK